LRVHLPVLLRVISIISFILFEPRLVELELEGRHKFFGQGRWRRRWRWRSAATVEAEHSIGSGMEARHFVEAGAEELRRAVMPLERNIEFL
jgi:hypothetical protein